MSSTLPGQHPHCSRFHSVPAGCPQRGSLRLAVHLAGRWLISPLWKSLQGEKNTIFCFICGQDRGKDLVKTHGGISAGFSGVVMRNLWRLAGDHIPLLCNPFPIMNISVKIRARRNFATTFSLSNNSDTNHLGQLFPGPVMNFTLNRQCIFFCNC